MSLLGLKFEGRFGEEEGDKDQKDYALKGGWVSFLADTRQVIDFAYQIWRWSRELPSIPSIGRWHRL